MRLKAKLLDPSETVFLYGTTPPRRGSAEDIIHSAAQKLVQRVERLPIDGIVVYDIQDEAGRTHLPRPFPFIETVEPREYSRLLAELSQKSVLTYKCVGDVDERAFREWLTQSTELYAVKFLSIVGRPTSGSAQRLPLDRAIRLAATHPGGVSVGGVVIAERHTPERSEALRLLTKSAEGAEYFISQTVYQADKSISLLSDYLRACQTRGVAPRRIILSFAPCGREKTMSFIKWLGVNVPPAIEARIFGASNPLAESIRICAEHLRQILEQKYFGQLPIGLSVESVSINRDELDATVDLFDTLREVWESVAGRST